MMTEKQVEALELAREALKVATTPLAKDRQEVLRAQAAIDEALMSVSDGAQERSSEEQPAQVDPCIDGSCSCCWTHLDEQPAQQQPWRGLTDEQIAPIIQQYHWLPTAFARAIEAKLRELNEHKEKNT